MNFSYILYFEAPGNDVYNAYLRNHKKFGQIQYSLIMQKNDDYIREQFQNALKQKYFLPSQKIKSIKLSFPSNFV